MHRFKALFSVIRLLLPPAVCFLTPSLFIRQKDALAALAFVLFRLLLLYSYCCKVWLKRHCSLGTDQDSIGFIWDII